MDVYTKPLIYCAIGDSLTVGMGTDLFSPGFVGLYQQHLQRVTNIPYIVKKIAKNGATSGEVLQAVQLPFCKDLIQASEVITVTAGANDLIQAGEQFLMNKDTAILFEAMNNATANLEKITDYLHALHHSHIPFKLRILNLYNPLPQIPEADQWIEQFNHHLNSLTKYPDTKIANIHSAFKGRQEELLVPGGVHPNDKGYAVMAEVLSALD